MRRTRGRPLPTHRLSTPAAMAFAAALALAAVLIDRWVMALLPLPVA